MVKVKCRLCGAELDKELAYQDKGHKGFYFCNNEHFIEYGEKHAKKTIKPPKSPNPPPNTQAYKDLVDYIYMLYDKNIPSFVFKQIKDLTTREPRAFTYKGIELSLRYWVETLDKPFDTDTGIGIVEYVYDDAERFWKDKQRVIKASRNYVPDNTITSGSRGVNIDALRYKLRKEKCND